MATAKQKAAARKNIKKAAAACEKEKNHQPPAKKDSNPLGQGRSEGCREEKMRLTGRGKIGMAG